MEWKGQRRIIFEWKNWISIANIFLNWERVEIEELKTSRSRGGRNNILRSNLKETACSNAGWKKISDDKLNMLCLYYLLYQIRKEWKMKWEFSSLWVERDRKNKLKERKGEREE